MDEHIERFEAYLSSKGYSQGTLYNYKRSLVPFTAFLKQRGVVDITDIKREHVFDYQRYLYHEYKPLKKKSLSLEYQFNLLKVVKVFFRYMAKVNIILSDPARDLELPKLPKKLPRGVMTKRQVKKLLNAPDRTTAAGYRDRAILELLYATGIRRQELRSLTVQNVNLEDREITIRKGKGGKDRVVPLTQSAMYYLENYMRKKRKILLGENNTDALFINSRSNPLHKNFIPDMIRKYTHKAGLRVHVTTHSFRHTCATHLLQNNANIRAIQELLGHESLSTTQKYTRVDITDLKRIVDAHHPREDMDV